MWLYPAKIRVSTSENTVLTARMFGEIYAGNLITAEPLSVSQGGLLHGVNVQHLSLRIKLFSIRIVVKLDNIKYSYSNFLISSVFWIMRYPKQELSRCYVWFSDVVVYFKGRNKIAKYMRTSFQRQGKGTKKSINHEINKFPIWKVEIQTTTSVSSSHEFQRAENWYCNCVCVCVCQLLRIQNVQGKENQFSESPHKSGLLISQEYIQILYGYIS
jgi:hypothetical protein